MERIPMQRVSTYLKALCSYYTPGYLPSLVYLLESTGYRPGAFFVKYWTAQSFAPLSACRPAPTVRNRALILFLTLGSLLQATTGLAMLVYGLGHELAEALPFGLAMILSYPVVWAHILGLAYAAYKLGWLLLRPKFAGRAAVCKILEFQVVRLRRRHSFTIIAVGGSIGKTSTKLAIAHTLEPTRRVIYQTGNYNDRVTVPLVLFGQELPNLLNVGAWARIFFANERTIRRPFFYDIAVLELGTDHPGDMAQFAYLQPEIAVVTAVTPEHMEYFGTLDAVAEEELTVCDYAKQVVVNADDTPPEYLHHPDLLTFGLSKQADFHASDIKPDGLKGSDVKLHLRQGITLQSHAAILGEQGIKILLAAAAAAQLAGLDKAEIEKGLHEVRPFAGRMQILQGIKDSTIIDDTYNASPVAVTAALDVLFAAKAPQRIAILGNMNELGDFSQQAHTEVGAYCQPKKLDLVVTIGPDAQKYLAPAARRAGCKVDSYASPYAAGAAVLKHLRKGAVVLAEGSQNQVFAEEALKVLLKNKEDIRKLVRQSDSWMKIKKSQFGDHTEI
jgi:UDP-N-acetylmuramoyl-tripeptide--D-alanyl-D-alanine ligase